MTETVPATPAPTTPAPTPTPKEEIPCLEFAVISEDCPSFSVDIFVSCTIVFVFLLKRFVLEEAPIPAFNAPEADPTAPILLV